MVTLGLIAANGALELLLIIPHPHTESTWYSAFSAFRAYALSNKSMLLATIIVLLALTPAATRIVSVSLRIVRPLVMIDNLSERPTNFI